MTDTADGNITRAVALNALLAGYAPGEEVTAPTIVRTGVTVEAGGDVERVLIAVANLVYRSGEFLYRAAAEVGDTVLLTEAQAKRLDALGATVDPQALDAAEAAAKSVTDAIDAGLATVPQVTTTPDGPPAGATLWTDEQIKAAKQPALVAYVGQYPDERARVRTLEETRGALGAKGGARAGVMSATAPTPVEDDQVEAAKVAQAEAEEAAKLAAANAGQVDPDDGTPDAE